MQTGLGTEILFPESVSLPVCRLISNTTISSLFWLATSNQFPDGSKLKLRGVFPKVD
jgi:hypothetical protein